MNSAASCLPGILCLGSSPHELAGRCRTVRGNLTQRGCFQKTVSHLGGGAAIPESLEGELDWREHPCLHFSASLIEKTAPGFAFLHRCPGAFPVAREAWH